jgi:hypothetical protein
VLLASAVPLSATASAGPAQLKPKCERTIDSTEP